MIKIITTNKKAYFNYEILEKYEAGIVLTGAEIKAIRTKKADLSGSFAKIMNPEKKKNPELFLVNCHIANVLAPERSKKLLMHHQEIASLIGKTQQKNLTLIALQLYLKRGRAKVQIGLARGKKLHDKREAIKKKDLQREMKKGLKNV